MRTTFIESGTNAGVYTSAVIEDAWLALDSSDFLSVTSAELTAKDAFSHITLSNKSASASVYVLLRDDGEEDTSTDSAIEILPLQRVGIPCNQLNNGFPVFSISVFASAEATSIRIDAIFTRRF